MRGRGAVSLIILLLAWAALDDITTDTANEFPLEYSILILAGVWFAALGAWLIVKRHAFAGVASLAAVAIAVVAFWSLPHHHQPLSRINYLGYLPLAWFAGLTVRFLVRRVRSTGS